MKPIRDEPTFESMGLEEILVLGRRLPEFVFKPQFRYFLFTTFDDWRVGLWMENFPDFLTSIDEDDYWLATIIPDPKLHYAETFGDFFGAFEFHTDDTPNEYFEAISGFPLDPPSIVADVIVMFSRSHRWALFADRDADIGVFGFTDHESMKALGHAWKWELFRDVAEAAEYGYGPAGINRAIDYRAIQAFCANYRESADG